MNVFITSMNKLELIKPNLFFEVFSVYSVFLFISVSTDLCELKRGSHHLDRIPYQLRNQRDRQNQK
jgi:hypothetical protein